MRLTVTRLAIAFDSAFAFVLTLIWFGGMFGTTPATGSVLLGGWIALATAALFLMALALRATGRLSWPAHVLGALMIVVTVLVMGQCC